MLQLQAPYNTLVYTAVDRFGNDLAFDYVGVTSGTGEIYIKRSLTQISDNTLLVSNYTKKCKIVFVQGFTYAFDSKFGNVFSTYIL